MNTENPDAGTLSDDDDLSMFLVREEPEDAADDIEDDTPDAAEAEPADDPDDDGDDTEAREAETDADPDEDDDPVIDLDGSREVRFSELKKGYLRQQDYTRKTQEVAEQRRALEAEVSGLSEQKQQLEAALTQWAVDVPQYDWVTLAQRLTPQQYQQARARYEAQEARAQQARHAYHALQAEQSQAEKERLLTVVPEWRDQTAARSELVEILGFAGDYGFSEQELAGVRDHRIFLLLRDAMKLYRVKSANVDAKKKVAATKSLPPGARSTKAEKAQRLRKSATDRFSKNPSDPDAFADWLLTK